MARANAPDTLAEYRAQLFAAPLDTFIDARQALARRLADEGDTAGAAEVRHVRKPPAHVWAVNQLGRRAREELDATIAAAAAAERAQAAAFTGHGGELLREAVARLRAGRRKLEAEAAAALAAAGHPSNAAMRDRIAAVLGDALRGEARRAALREGHFTGEEEFVPALFVAGPAERKPPPSRRTGEIVARSSAPIDLRTVRERRETEAQSARAVREAEWRATRLRREAEVHAERERRRQQEEAARDRRRLEAEVQRAREDARAKVERAKRARREADVAQVRVREAEKRVKQEQARAEEADARAREAEQAAREAEERAKEAATKPRLR